jgi:hypothetical protein
MQTYMHFYGCEWEGNRVGTYGSVSQHARDVVESPISREY